MFGKIIEKVESYIETKIEIAKLEVTEQISALVVKLVQVIVFMMLAATAILFINIAIATLLNQVLQSMYAGYAIIAIFYTALSIILYIYRDSHIFKSIRIFNPKINLPDDK